MRQKLDEALIGKSDCITKYYLSDLKGEPRIGIWKKTNPEIHFYEQSSPSNKTIESKHKTAKPKAIFKWLILTYTDINAIVFDGCMGGGTTAVAADKTKRNFIGFEIEKEFTLRWSSCR